MTPCKRLIDGAGRLWRDYTNHLFVQRLGDGSLDATQFIYYLKQDYRYLLHYGRVFGLAAYKAQSFEELSDAHDVLRDVLHEKKLHTDFCRDWGLSLDDLQNVVESPACVAYTRYLLDCAACGDRSELYAAAAPCALGYVQIGQTLAQKRAPNHPYRAWIDKYADDDFAQNAYKIGAKLDAFYQNATAQQQARLQSVFCVAVRMEIAFWQAALDLQ